MGARTKSPLKDVYLTANQTNLPSKLTLFKQKINMSSLQAESKEQKKRTPPGYLGSEKPVSVKRRPGKKPDTEAQIANGWLMTKFPGVDQFGERILSAKEHQLRYAQRGGPLRKKGKNKRNFPPTKNDGLQMQWGPTSRVTSTVGQVKRAR